jgi:hypothetical protein
VSLPDFGTVIAEAADRPAFSNGTEGEAWMARWCYRCLHDQGEEGCPLVLAAFLGKTPAQWREDQPGSLGDQYTCDLFEVVP